jgi:hypothetical protein
MHAEYLYGKQALNLLAIPLQGKPAAASEGPTRNSLTVFQKLARNFRGVIDNCGSYECKENLRRITS